MSILKEENKTPLLRTLARLPRALKFLAQGAPGLFVTDFSLSVLSGALPAVILLLERELLNGLPADAALGSVTEKTLWVLAGIVGLSTVYRIIGSLGARLKGRMRFYNELHYQQVFLKKTRELNLEVIEGAEHNKRIEKIEGERWRLNNLPESITFGVSDVISTVTVGAVLIGLFPGVIIGLVFLRICGMYFENMIWRAIWGHTELRTQARRLARQLYIAALQPENLKETRQWGLEKHFAKLSGSLLREQFDLEQKVTTKYAVMSAIADVLGLMCYGIGAYFIVQQYALGLIGLGMVAIFMQSVVRLESAMRGIMWTTRQAVEGLEMFGTIEELLAETSTRSEGRTSPEQILPLALEHASFRYQGMERDALSDITFTVPQGKIIGVVGQNGAGKSTLLRLLSLLYAPTAGKILVNGVPSEKINSHKFRRHMSVIFQDYGRYGALKAGGSIGLGDIERKSTEAALEKAVQQGGATEVIEQLPHGWETVLQKGWDKGVDLSGGQWQKIVLSRAMYRESAQLIVLDEPTSAFDAKAEWEFFQAFAKQVRKEKKTAIIVSHRFSNIRLADHILVLDKGRIAEQGTHEELMEKNGMYAELYTLQKQSLE